MAELVAAYAVSHSSLMISQQDMVTEDVRDRCYAAMRTVREHLAEVAPDTLIVLGTDHFNNYSYDLLPAWCLGRGEKFEGFGDNMPHYTVPGDYELSDALLRGLIGDGFEPALADDMKLDHSFLGPLHFITPDMTVPIVPLFQNCLASPFPLPARSYDLGGAIRAVLERSAVGRRVAVVGTGGLSHWIGGPDHGRLNEDYDRRFLDRFLRNDRDWLRGLDEETIEANLGNGGQEVRNWLTVRGCAEDFDAREIYYEAIDGWLVGAAVSILERV